MAIPRTDKVVSVPVRPCWLVTGGAGFIGSAFVLACQRADRARVINLDALTYSGNLMNLADLDHDPDHVFVHGDIGDRELVRRLLASHAPEAIINFAAETHVDRSIHDPEPFIRTNIQGASALLSETLDWWRTLPEPGKKAFRFLHVSTDEVYGSLRPEEASFTERTPYAPNSPYAASKAASDHFVRAFNRTYGLPTLITNCSNNYGPRQFPEKLIPLMILNALAWERLPIYGQGRNIRDWLHVDDHCQAIMTVLEKGIPGQAYNIGGRAEKSNLEVVLRLCAMLDEMAPSQQGSYDRLITYVTDRPGHDFRYSINPEKIERELGWQPIYDFDSGLRETVAWYLDNSAWVKSVQSGEYRDWLRRHYNQT